MSHEHFYFYASLLMLLVAATLILFTKRLRGLLLVSGCLASPFALISFLFIPAYWDPPVLFHVVTCPEDLVFSFSAGVIGGWLPYLLFARGSEFNVNWRRVFARYLGYSLLGLGIMIVLVAVLGASRIMVGTLTGMAAGTLLVLRVRPELLLISAIGAASFVSFYGLLLALVKLAAPGYFDYWTPSAQLPFTILDVPAFEWIWALFYGVWWPTLMAHAFDFQIRPSSATAESL